MSIRRIAEVAAFARTRGEIVTTAELAAAGLDPRIAERQVRSGKWQRPPPRARLAA